MELTAHADALPGSYIYGFALQEAALPFSRETVSEATEAIMQQFAGEAASRRDGHRAHPPARS